MIASLPQLNTAEIEKKHSPITASLAHRAETLKARPLTAMTANLAAELDLEAKRFLDAAERERTTMKAPVLEAGRNIDAFFAKLTTPAAQVRAICTGVGVKFTDGGIVGRFNKQERLRVEAELRERERLALEAEKARKAAEVAHLVEEAAATNDESLLAEAERVEAEPLLSPAVPVPPPVQTPGISTAKDKKVFQGILDAYLLMRWLMQIPDNVPVDRARFDSLFAGWFEAKEGGFNRSLASGLEVPHITIATINPSINRMR